MLGYGSIDMLLYGNVVVQFSYNNLESEHKEWLRQGHNRRKQVRCGHLLIP